MDSWEGIDEQADRATLRRLRDLLWGGAASWNKGTPAARARAVKVLDAMAMIDEGIREMFEPVENSRGAATQLDAFVRWWEKYCSGARSPSQVLQDELSHALSRMALGALTDLLRSERTLLKARHRGLADAEQDKAWRVDLIERVNGLLCSPLTKGILMRLEPDSLKGFATTPPKPMAFRLLSKASQVPVDRLRRASLRKRSSKK